jgi:hypothetical protein
VAEEVLLQEEKAVHQEKVQAVVEATETQVQRRWIWWKKLCSREGVLAEVQLKRFFRQSSRRSESFGDSPRPRRPRRD